MKKILLLLLCAVFSAFIPVFSADASLDEMIGQMIILGFNGNRDSSRGFKDIIKDLNDGKISGVIFFEDNIKNPENLYEMTEKIYKTRMQTRPFIAVDMEGGYIQRLNSQNGFTDFPSALEIAKENNSKKAGEVYSNMADVLSSKLFNLNFAPCVDLDINENSILHQKQRSYSGDPAKVSIFADEFIKAHYDKNIITTLKHFPGHGSVSGDTHLNFTDATETYKDIELTPYEDLMFKNDLQMVMVSHIFNKNLDEIYPASLSYDTVSGLLRREMGYKGVVITDDLDMGAIRQNFDLEETVIQAINAGNDILLFSNRKHHNPNLADDINKIIKNAILEGLIEPSRIPQSYERIIKLKQTLVTSEKK